MRTLLFLVALGLPAAAQDSKRELWPEFDIYVNYGLRTRIVFVDSFNQDQHTRNAEGSFSYYFDLALRPVFRRDLRLRDDVFRRRFLTFRAGYQYTTSLANGDSSSENRAIIETTARYPLPGKVVVSDRNRGEFRFIKGQAFSTRYRNRLWVERDLNIRPVVLTPFVFGEIFYDTRYDAWSRLRYAAGLQIPAGPHVVFEPYLLRQNDWRATLRYVNALGLTLNLYF